jgi:predicted MFS family arabinose efflux permease
MTERNSYKAYVLAALTAVVTFNYVDRCLITLLLQPIKVDLRLTDTQLGLLTGIAFGLFYATLGLPIARWADRGNRVTITSLAIGLWAVTTMATIFVGNFAQLLLARIAAGVGESGCMPPTYSLVGDYYPRPEERTRAMTIYMLAGSLATMVSFTLGGWLNEESGWRATLFTMGAPALLLAVAVRLTVREPARARAAPERTARITHVMQVLWKQRSTRNLTVGIVLFWTMGLGLMPWYAAFMMRSHGMGTAELGAWLGALAGTGGAIGILLGGYAANRWFAANESAQMRLSSVTVAALVPCYLLFLLLPNKHQALLAFMPLVMLFNCFLGPTFALLQRLVADNIRATTLAIVMMLANLIGMGIGPQIVGLISDSLAPVLGVDSLRYAMLAMSLIAFGAAYYFWKVSNTVTQDLRTVQRCAPYPVRSGPAVPGVS